MTDLNKEREAFELFELNKRPCATPASLFERFDSNDLGEDEQHYVGRYVDSYMQEKWELWQKAKAQAVPEGYVVVPKGVLDLTRFMCKTWAEIDNFVYKNCTNLGEYPVIQGTSNQFNLAKIGNQKVDNKAIPSAVKWFLESESEAEG
ncbi:hypothetical protein [Acinetobacter baumannii]|uniref:hypothetical protein n=1 Tax=Acinetobacter baumannii TaxID=470 RepID=UPI001C079E02|nr:hypothetical protein [Acinetobacter baumannii]MDP7921944.1 hypothetical protein [Acinetobacter baumannii]